MLSQRHSLADEQALFGQALLNPLLSVPDGVVGRDGRHSVRRFNVYRNNVVLGQISTLADAHPAVVRLVSEEFFTAMAREYVLRHPPTSPVMLEYGESFAAFIDLFEPTQALPYLGDVARVERAWVEAYHAAEAEPSSNDELAAVMENDLRFISLKLHPSVRVIQSRFPTLAIWRINTGREKPRTIQLDEGGDDILIARPQHNVHVHRLARGGATFFLALQQGHSIVEAAEQAFEAEPQFDVVANVNLLLDAQLVVGTSLYHRNAPDYTHE
jgi:hypothetical protein